jgi:transcriptional regulator with XRE-family HTH domain
MKKNELLEKLRKDLGYSRKKIAEFLEVSPTTIERYEKGKLNFNEKIKYIQGISALYGIDSSIFNVDIDFDLKSEYIQKHLLSKFSKNFRLLLYFLNFDITQKEYQIFLSEIVFDYFNKTTDFIINTNESPLCYNDLINCYKYTEINFLNHSQEKEPIIKQLKRDNYLKCLLSQIIVTIALNTFNPKDFFEKNILDYILKNFDELNFSEFLKKLHLITATDVGNFGISAKEMLELKKQILIDFNTLIKQGISLTKENIKLYQFKIGKFEKSQNLPAPTDPKDKQICELLQYAPPAFKDKIIEKLLKFKDEVEDI